MRLKQLHVKIGIATINNVALDFKRNYNNIMKSIEQCIDMGCSIRIGSQLQIPGYGCADHFLQYDTIYHSWDVVRDILASGFTDKIICEVGVPVLHKAALYNGRVILHQSKVVAIRVKTIGADGDCYFETRTFSTWKLGRQVGDFKLPQVIQQLTGQINVPIGVFIVNYNDTSIAYEICQQAWISNNPMIDAALDGAQIFINGSASESVRGKLKRKIQMIQQLTQRHGGAYLYVNQRGLMDRQFFQGGNIVTQNGKTTYLSELFQLQEVSVMPVIINLNKIRTFRLSNRSFQKQSHGVNKIPRVIIKKSIANNSDQYLIDSPQYQSNLKRIKQMYQCSHATCQPSVYLWDFLRHSGASGFHISLSGGKNSCSVALIVYNLCCIVYDHIQHKKSSQILQSLRKILRQSDYYPKSVKQLCGKLLFTTYMQTQNSSIQTKERSRHIASELNSNHRQIDFQQIYLAFKKIGQKQLGYELKYQIQGGTHNQEVALAGIQSRSRMTLSYFISQINLESHKKKGYLIKLASLNLDYLLRGYFTKYDCSSADINPIGSFSVKRIKQFLEWNYKIHKFSFIKDCIDQIPTQEIKPFIKQKAKSIQEEMDLTYEQLSMFGELRKIEKFGPVSMFDRIYDMRKFGTPQQLAQKIKTFFVHYSTNRHKMSTMTPIMHFNPQGCDDNRLDMRPMIYATNWEYQFDVIDERVRQIKSFLQRKNSGDLGNSDKLDAKEDQIIQKNLGN